MSKLESFVRLSGFQYSAQIITIFSAMLYSFVAANFLGPEKYGLVYYLMGFLAGLPFIFGFETVYDVLKFFLARYKSVELLKKIIPVAIVFLLVFTFLSIVFSDFVVSFAGKGTKELVILFSAVIFFVPLVSVVESIFIGFKQFGKVLLLVAVQQVLGLVLLLVFLFIFHLDYMSLFYSTICSIIITLFVSIIFMRKIKFLFTPVPKIEFNSYFLQAWISNVIKGVLIQVELWVFGLTLPLAGFGIFYLIRKLAIYLFELPQIALSEVVFPFLSEEKDDEKIVLYTSKVIKFQVLLGAVIGIFAIIFIPLVLPIFFPAFASGVVIFPLFVFGYALYFGAPLSRLLKATNNNNLLSLFFAFYIVLIVILGFVLIPAYGIFGAAIALLLTKILSGFFLYFICRYLGYKIGIIPNKEDIKFFVSSMKKFAIRAIVSIKRRFSEID